MENKKLSTLDKLKIDMYYMKDKYDETIQAIADMIDDKVPEMIYDFSKEIFEDENTELDVDKIKNAVIEKYFDNLNLEALVKECLKDYKAEIIKKSESPSPCKTCCGSKKCN